MPHFQPEISVVVPLFNKRQYILRCLESIQRQSHRKFEVVVIDDGSTDGSGVIASQFGDPRFRVIRQLNRGEGAARNRGIAESSSTLIAFLDADDAWEPLFLEAVANLSKQYPDAGLYATGYRRIFHDGLSRETTIRNPGPDGTALIHNYFAAVREGHFVTSSSVAVPRRILTDTGGFIEGEPIGADGDLWARICLHWPIAYDQRVLATYHSESEGRSFDLWRERPPYPPVVRSLRRILTSSPVSPEIYKEVESYMDSRLMGYAYWLLGLGKREQWLEFLREETFSTPRFRFEAASLRALAVLPPRLLMALRHKPENLWRRLLSLIRKADSGGRYVVTRTRSLQKAPSPALASRRTASA